MVAIPNTQIEFVLLKVTLLDWGDDWVGGWESLQCKHEDLCSDSTTQKLGLVAHAYNLSLGEGENQVSWSFSMQQVSSDPLSLDLTSGQF